MSLAASNIISVVIAILLLVALFTYYDRDLVIIGLVPSIAAGLFVSAYRHSQGLPFL